MVRLIVLMLSAVLLLSLVGCGCLDPDLPCLPCL